MSPARTRLSASPHFSLHALHTLSRRAPQARHTPTSPLSSLSLCTHRYGGLLLTFVGGFVCSVHAIESPGGDDDRQWLTFWMIMMSCFAVERVTDVLLSRVPIYYEGKFVFIVWLMYFHGV